MIALWTATFTGSAIVGPILGGFLYTVGPGTAYSVAAVLELASIVPILRIVYVREQERLKNRPTLSAAMQGLQFVRRTPIVLAVISLDLFAVLFGGAVALIPASRASVWTSATSPTDGCGPRPGIGAATMAIWLAIRPVQRRVGPTLLVVVGVVRCRHRWSSDSRAATPWHSSRSW